MLKRMRICDGRLVEAEETDAPIQLYIHPDEGERRYLTETLKIDEHTLTSALDPDELARLEFEPEHVAMIFKRPKNYSSEDNFAFKVVSTGLFLFKDRLVIVSADEPAFDGKPFQRLQSLSDLILRMIYRTIFHYEQHLKMINMISSELEQEINTAMENKHLLNLFALEKSLVYYVNAISSNAVLIEKLKINAAKIGFTAENLELLDDIIIENNQCYGQAQIHSNILASLMDARASIVANNLNVLMKALNIIMIALMLPTLVVSIFSMNVPLPIPAHGVSFWVVLAISATTALAVILIWRYKRL